MPLKNQTERVNEKRKAKKEMDVYLKNHMIYLSTFLHDVEFSVTETGVCFVWQKKCKGVAFNRTDSYVFAKRNVRGDH